MPWFDQQLDNRYHSKSCYWVGLIAKDIQHESGAVEKPMDAEPVLNDHQTDTKPSLSQVVKQTDVIGTAEHPTIEGGLISAPELVEVNPEAVDEISLIITTKLNEIFNRSPMYNSKMFLSMAMETVRNSIENVKAKSDQIWKLWTKSVMEKTNKKSPPRHHQRVKHHGKH